mgnify:CR=1 FL=1
MSDSTYKVIEIVGTSSNSWEEAARTAVKTAAKSVKDLRVAEVVKMDMTIEKAYATLDIDDSHLDNSEDSIVEMLKKELGITQTQLAKELGISLQALNQKLNGKTDLSINEAEKIIRVLRIENPNRIFFNH